MNLKSLASSNFCVVAVVDERNRCEAEEFILEGDASTHRSRGKLVYMLNMVSEHGLDGVPSSWFHLANQQEKIYAFRSGDLRLFFFKGKNGEIAVCTGGSMKKGQKADKALVAKAIDWRDAYFS